MNIEQIKEILKSRLPKIDIQEFHGVNSPSGEILIWIYFDVESYESKIEIDLLGSEDDLYETIEEIERELKEFKREAENE